MILSAANFKCRFCDARYELLLFLNKKTKHLRSHLCLSVSSVGKQTSAKLYGKSLKADYFFCASQSLINCASTSWNFGGISEETQNSIAIVFSPKDCLKSSLFSL